jgi:hypothetical protein
VQKVNLLWAKLVNKIFALNEQNLYKNISFTLACLKTISNPLSDLLTLIHFQLFIKCFLAYDCVPVHGFVSVIIQCYKISNQGFLIKNKISGSIMEPLKNHVEKLLHS